MEQWMECANLIRETKPRKGQEQFREVGVCQQLEQLKA